MNIDIGTYIRTKDGRITTIENVFYNCEGYKTEYILKNISKDMFGSRFTENDFKPSKNLIDLIEVGDYVNGMEVIDIDMSEKPYLIFNHGISAYVLGMVTYMGDDKLYGIESIVTKEQFKANEYVIKE